MDGNEQTIKARNSSQGDRTETGRGPSTERARERKLLPELELIDISLLNIYLKVCVSVSGYERVFAPFIDTANSLAAFYRYPTRVGSGKRGGPRPHGLWAERI